MSFIIRRFTALRLTLILSISNIRLDRIINQCHGFDDIRYVFLNSVSQPPITTDDAMLLNSRITLFVNCNKNSIIYVLDNPSKFEVIKVEIG